jgi:hypothetical protein
VKTAIRRKVVVDWQTQETQFAGGDQMQNRIWLFVLVLLSASCVHQHDRNTSYFCEATLSNENGQFKANRNEVEWRHDLGRGAWITVGLSHAWQSAESFRADGFDHALDSPAMVIGFDPRLNHNDWMQEPPRLSVAGQISVGPRAETRWVSNLNMIVFMYSSWSGLFDENGDMDVTMYEAESRAVLQRATIPRRALESVEPTLQRLSAEAAEMERDPQNRCRVLEEEEVTLT